MPREPDAHSLSRRRFLQLTAAGAAAVTHLGWMGELVARAAPASTTQSVPMACILIWMAGGPSHVDTFDPKPDSPQGRSPFEAIKTSVPDLRFSALLPDLAKQAHRMAVIRGMSSTDVDHPLASFAVHTGYRQGSGDVEHPGIGAVVAKRLGDPQATLPGYILLKESQVTYGTGAGMLGPDYQPLFVAGNGVIANASSHLKPDEFAKQVELLTSLNDRYVDSHQSRAATDQARTLARSIRLMSGSQLAAFEINREPQALREAYGESNVGRSCLRARRLIEAGVPFVEIYCDDWDTHGDIKAGLPLNARPFDRAAAALIEDLHQRGLAERTLVVMVGEFGRTPTLNSGGGRDHYAKAWSAAMACGGVKGGSVAGKTDPTGGEVIERPVTLTQFLSTVYTLLGIDPLKPLPSPGRRPVPMIDFLNQDATPVREIMA